MKIRDILKNKSQEVITVGKDKTVHDAIKVLVEHKIGALLVLDENERLVGIISERDILRESAERDHLLRTSKVEQVMTRELIIGVPGDDIDYTMGIMTNNRIRHMPILEGDDIVGIVSIGDLVKAQLAEQKYDNRYLQQYMFGH